MPALAGSGSKPSRSVVTPGEGARGTALRLAGEWEGRRSDEEDFGHARRRRRVGGTRSNEEKIACRFRLAARSRSGSRSSRGRRSPSSSPCPSSRGERSLWRAASCGRWSWRLFHSSSSWSVITAGVASVRWLSSRSFPLVWAVRERAGPRPVFSPRSLLVVERGGPGRRRLVVPPPPGPGRHLGVHPHLGSAAARPR